MNTLEILFDVSGSMKEKFEGMKDSKEINKKSDELIQILKNIGKNSHLNISAMLFGLLDEPYIIDFIRLLKVSNKRFKKIKSGDNEKSTIFREKLINYLSKDINGKERFCDIKKYVLSSDGPSEKLSEFLCNIMEEDRTFVDNIYNSLPKEVTEQETNKKLNKKIGLSKAGATSGFVLGGIGIGISLICPIALPFAISTIMASTTATVAVNKKVNEAEKEETIKAINNSFGKCIEAMSMKIMNQYKEEKNEEYELITGQQLCELIEEMNQKIVQPKNNNINNINIIDIYEKYIYGDTPLYTSCMKAFSILEKINNNNKVLLIISDGLLNDFPKEKAEDEIKKKIKELQIITVCVFLNSSNNSNNNTFYN